MTKPQQGWFVLLACLATAAACDSNGGTNDAGDTQQEDADGHADADADGDGDAADDGAPTACTPDSVEECACTGDIVGSRRCLHDGSVFPDCECTPYALSIWVRADATGGDGSRETPYGTLEDARDDLRTRRDAGTLPDGPIVVWLRGGLYELNASFELAAEDSGTATAPITWRSFPGESARLAGGRRIDPTCFEPVPSSSPIAARLDPAARDSILACDLHTQGISDYGTLEQRGMGGPSANVAALELFIDQAPMRLARWPDADAHEPGPDPLGEALDVYGTITPDASGHYVRFAEQDGVSAFRREGLVGGLQYNLHRYTWVYEGNNYTAWFLTTTESGYPGSDPFWYRYEPTLGPMEGSSGATGTATVDPPGRINHGFTSTGETLSTTEFRYFGDRPARWTTAPDPWAHGLFRWSWADWHLPITAVDTTARTLTLANEPPYGLAAARPYYASNLLEEITQAGEFYVDRTTGILYLFPPGELAGAEVLVSMLESPVVRLSDASWIVLRDLVVEAGRANLVEIDGGGDVVVEGCELRNGGIDALDAWNGERVTVRRCHIHGLGDGGILVSGGDRRSLTPAGHLVENCDIHDVGRFCWMYTPAVRVEGAGSTVRKNHLHELPHSAILWGGNEHLLELNEIDHVCNWASDAGAIYAGRDWGARGNVIRHNLVRHMSTFVEGWGVHGIYLDDCLSGVTVEGNIVYDVSGLGLLLGGGRDNIIRYNVLAKCGSGLSADSRGPDNINDTPGDSWNLLEKLLDVGYRDEPWASRYPTCAAIPATFAEISAPGTGWMYPEGVVLQGNLGWQNSQFARQEAGTFAWFAVNADNVEDADPRFVDEAAGNLALQPDSPAYAIPGFEAIPYDDIGIAP